MVASRFIWRLDLDHDGPVENAQRFGLGDRSDVGVPQLELGLAEDVATEAEVLLSEVHVADSLDDSRRPDCAVEVIEQLFALVEIELVDDHVDRLFALLLFLAVVRRDHN